MKYIVSIIIPVFNAEIYLPELFQSILEQEYFNFEVIIINDGSTDSSEEICHRICYQDNRFVLINQTNKGLSNARNRGVSCAKGKYIWFVDADDMLVEHSISFMARYIEEHEVNPDIVFANAEMFNAQGIFNGTYYYPYDVEHVRNCDADDLMYYFWNELDVAWSVWRNWYKTDFIRKEQIHFDEKQINYEATDWIINTIIAGKYFSASQQNIYRYRIDNLQSIVHKEMNLTIFMYLYNNTVKWFRFFETNNKWRKARKTMLGKFARQYIYLSSRIQTLPPEDRRKAISLYRANHDIFRFNERNSYE